MSRRAQLPLRRLSFRPQVELLESRNLLSFGPPNNFPVDAGPLGVTLADALSARDPVSASTSTCRTAAIAPSVAPASMGASAGRISQAQSGPC